MSAGRLIRFWVWCLVAAWLGAASVRAAIVSGDSPNTVVDSREPLVANVRVGQRVGTKLVDVDYDLSRSKKLLVGAIGLRATTVALVAATL